MRRLRNFKPDRCYHLISRIAHRAFFLTDEERTRFVNRLWRVAAFSGVEIIAYCIMSNHFHVLAYFPEAPEIDDAELFVRIRKLYSGERLSKILKEWETYTKYNDQRCMDDFRRRFKNRMYDVSAFMKTLKQNSTMSYNCRRVHAGTMWESRFRAREFLPEEKIDMMTVAGYIDRNPVKAKIVPWPDKYPWCSFAAACNGDERCIDGYRFIYSFAPIPWSRLRECHEKSIGLAIKELEEDAIERKAKLASVDEEKREKAKVREWRKFESEMPTYVPRLLEKGSNKIAFDLLKLLKNGPRRPAELRLSLGLSSANFFTSRYLTPLAKSGFIAIEGGEANRYSPNKRYILTRRGKSAAQN